MPTVASPIPFAAEKSAARRSFARKLGAIVRGMRAAENSRQVTREFNFGARSRRSRGGSARSKRSAFITLVHAATKSFTNFSFESAHA